MIPILIWRYKRMTLGQRIRESQVWRSIMRHGIPGSPRDRAKMVIGNLVLHLHPMAVKRHSLDFRFTWCMGGITAFFFLVETVTGVLLMFYYRPTTEWAYHDILDLRDVVTLGIVREVHRWGAHAMVIAVMLHMLRVFLTGSYKPPREFNWVIGVMLLVLTLLLSFTGYLLPWDQLAMWAVTVGSNMARSAPLIGGEGPGQPILAASGFEAIRNGCDARYVLLGANSVREETLNRFYVLHCIAIPLACMAMMALHFWRIRKDGGISGPL
jgi:quinol-cytochrome oxidoreductase complex cytochrome b subunit